MQVLQPETLADALRARRELPEAVVVAGGTEVMPGRNRGERPGPLLDLSRVGALREVRDGMHLGAGVTYARLIEELGDRLPLAAAAARTIASRQIRNRATIGGALAIADPSADILAALLAADAQVEAASVSGVRRLPLAAFVTGPYACALAPDELVTAVRVRPAAGPAAYAKVGARNAMARAACAVAVGLDVSRRRVSIAVAACGPTPLRAPEAEERFAAEAPWDAAGELDGAWLEAIGALVAQATRPRADRRGSAAYKRHAAEVLARRALGRAWRGRTEPAWA